MSAFQQKYKEKIIGFGNTKESRFIRAKEREESRKRQRAENFNNCRNIPTSGRTENTKMQSNHVVKDNSTRFMKWKAEQERRRIEQMKKKRPFVVGIVHHKLYSPIPSYQTTNSNVTNNKVCNKTVPMSSAPLSKKITKATEKRLMSKGLTKEVVDQSSKRQQSLNNGQKKQEQQDPSFAPTDYKSESRTQLSRIPLFVGITVNRISHTKISKSVLSSIKISETSKISNTTECTVENVNHENNNIAVIEKQEDADDSNESCIEPTLLKLLCDEERFTSYNEINNNNNDDNELKVQDNDVCNSSTTKALCSSKDNMFILEPNDPQDEAIFYSPYVVLSCKRTSARKEQQSECVFSLSHLKDESEKCTPVKQDKTQLNQEVQLSAALESIGNLPTVQRVGQTCKTLDVQLDNEIFCVNSNQTPRKSILNEPNNSIRTESSIKSTIKVKVDQNIISNEVLVNQEILLKPDLFISPKIDGFNVYSPEVTIDAKKKLSFNSEEFDDGNLQNSVNREGSEVSSTKIHTTTPLKHSDLNKSTKPSKYNENIKVLRNKVIIVVHTPTPKKSVKKVNVQKLKQKENKTPLVKKREKSFVEVTADHKMKNPQNCLDKIVLNANSDKRKYRRSVKSSEKDYYVSNKPATPTY